MIDELEFYRDFVRWLEEEAFGKEQFKQILDAYYEGRRS